PALDPGGYDPVTGRYHDPVYGDTMFAVVRLTTAGALDSGYGTGGVARSTYATGTQANLPTAFATQSDGTCALAVGTDTLHAAVFGATGTVAFNKAADLGYEFGTPLDMTVKSDGRFFVLGENNNRPHGLDRKSTRLNSSHQII